MQALNFNVMTKDISFISWKTIKKDGYDFIIFDKENNNLAKIFKEKNYFLEFIA